MNRRKFDFGAYGKPRAGPVQASKSRVEASESIFDGSKDLERSKRQSSCDDVLKTSNESAKVDLAPKHVPTQVVPTAATTFVTAPEPGVKLSTSISPKGEDFVALTTANATASTLPVSNKSTTHLQTESFTFGTTPDPSSAACASQSTVPVPRPAPALVSHSALRTNALKVDGSTQVLESPKSSPLHKNVTPQPENKKTRLGSHVGAMSTQRQPTQAVTKNARLKELQKASLHQISRKAAAEKIKPTNASVSIRDLDLARKAVDPQNPQSSFRRWAQDSPLYTGGYGEGNAAFSSIQKELSVLPQPTSTDASPAQVEPVPYPDTECARYSKWPAREEMKAEKVEAGSDDWGSQIPSDATQCSNVSDESLGKLLRRQEPAKEESLYDWQGNMMPPPADWAERPRYNNNNPDFKNQFRNYVGQLAQRFSNRIPIPNTNNPAMQDENYVPDGIGMVHRSYTVDISNAKKYGYQLENNPELYEAIVKYGGATHDKEFELAIKLDPSDEDNANHNPDETTESLVANWNRHLANARGETFPVEMSRNNHTIGRNNHEVGPAIAAPIEEKAPTEVREDEDEDEDDDVAAPLAVPTLNIYLRPGTDADLSELTRIYNWYIVNGSQPSELREVGEAAMQSRMKFCKESKLPFIVAALKSQKNAKRIPTTNDEDISRRHQLPVTHKQHVTLTRIEKLAGFCCANDFSQPDFIEYLAADIEIYVDTQYRRMGVARTLMDKMLHICDRNHTLTMDVPFHCDQDIRHLYGAGGNRDLHKMIITLRNWSTPRPFAINIHGKRKPRKFPLAKTEENDYDRWLKAWFESLGFEEEGRLKKMGAKNGRYIDIVYLGRSTCYEPPEGKVPDPPQEFLNAYDYDEDDEGGL